MSCTLNALHVRSWSLGHLFCLVDLVGLPCPSVQRSDGGDECLPVSATGLRLNEDRSGTWQAAHADG